MKYVVMLLISANVWAQENVDLQWAVCESSAGNLVQTLEFKKAKKPKQSTYYDDQNFSLTQHDMHLKVTVGSSKANSSVKAGTNTIPAVGGASCEIDRYGNNRLRRCSLEQEVAGETWTSAQKEFFEAYAGKIDWNGLKPYGPFVEQKWERNLDGMDLKLEVLFGPNGDPISEISAKTTETMEEATYQLVTQWLLKNNIRLCPVQEGKAQRLMRKLPAFAQLNQ